MNTPTAKTSLLSALIAILLPLIRRRSHELVPNLYAPPERYGEERNRASMQSWEESLPAALKRVIDQEPHGFPTKAALRSYLSIGGPSTRGDETITGFDDLYNELLALFSLKHIVEVSELRKDLNNALQQREMDHNAHRQSSAAAHDRHKTEVAKLRHDFQAATNSYEKEAESLRQRNSALSKEIDRLRNLIHRDSTDSASIIPRLRKDIEAAKTANNNAADALYASREMNRMKDNHITALESKVAKLSGLPTKEHWDDTLYGHSVSSTDPYFDTLTAEKVLAAWNNRPRPQPLPQFLIIDNTQQINDLNYTIGVLTNERNSVQQDIKRAVSAYDRTVATCEATLAEFKIESPTNSIPDMVRAACEAAKFQRERADAELVGFATSGVRKDTICRSGDGMLTGVTATQWEPVSRNVKTTTVTDAIGEEYVTREEFTHYEPADIDEPYRPGQLHPSTNARVESMRDTLHAGGSLSNHRPYDGWEVTQPLSMGAKIAIFCAATVGALGILYHVTKHMASAQ